jgi:hypothetical protein
MTMPKTEAEFRAMLAALPEETRAGFEQMMTTMRPWESLDPELAENIVVIRGVTFLKHPMLFVPLYVPGVQDGQLNEVLRRKKEAREQMLDEGAWWQYVFLIYERPYQLDALLDVADQIGDAEFWDLVGDVWRDTENAYEQYDLWYEVFHLDRACREEMMNAEEQEFLAKQPDQIKVYRGAATSLDGAYDAADGFAWTLRKSKARWFAERFRSLFESEGAVPEILTARVEKKNVVAYFDGRGEREILVLPEHVHHLRREHLAPAPRKKGKESS